MAEGSAVVQLQAGLQVLSAGVSVFNNAHARRLAEQAELGDQADAVLGQGLVASDRRTRAAAAQMLGRLGRDALPNLPDLVRRLYDRRRFHRDTAVQGSAAATLLHLLPTLPEQMQTWLAYLANPLRRPESGLRNALENAPLPESVRRQFIALCERRAAWRTQLAAQSRRQRHAEPIPAWSKDPAAWRAAQAVLRHAEHAALRHATAEQDARVMAQAGRDKEAAWLLARLCELMLRASEGTEANPA
jgi:hypothetical protein